MPVEKALKYVAALHWLYRDQWSLVLRRLDIREAIDNVIFGLL
jgi:hypothetical protein